MLTELLILLVVRTQRLFFKSRPARALALSALGVAAVMLALPYLPLILLGPAIHLLLPQLATFGHSLQVLKALKLMVFPRRVDPG